MNQLQSTLLALCASAATSFAQDKAQFVSKLEEGDTQTIVTYGTSLTAGGAWVEQLRSILNKKFPNKATILNTAKSAMGSNWGLENLADRVLEKKPDAVFIEFSINDAYLSFKTATESARKNLESMIDQILSSHPRCEIILTVMNPPIAEHLAQRPNIVEYNQIYRDVAQERKLLLIDYYPAWQNILAQGEDQYRALVSDGIHPDPIGCETVITPLLLERVGLKGIEGSKPPTGKDQTNHRMNTKEESL